MMHKKKIDSKVSALTNDIFLFKRKNSQYFLKISNHLYLPFLNHQVHLFVYNLLKNKNFILPSIKAFVKGDQFYHVSKYYRSLKDARQVTISFRKLKIFAHLITQLHNVRIYNNEKFSNIPQ
jgi:hypothetical protein